MVLLSLSDPDVSARKHRRVRGSTPPPPYEAAGRPDRCGFLSKEMTSLHFTLFEDIFECSVDCTTSLIFIIYFYPQATAAPSPRDRGTKTASACPSSRRALQFVFFFCLGNGFKFRVNKGRTPQGGLGAAGSLVGKGIFDLRRRSGLGSHQCRRCQ